VAYNAHFCAFELSYNARFSLSRSEMIAFNQW